MGSLGWQLHCCPERCISFATTAARHFAFPFPSLQYVQYEELSHGKNVVERLRVRLFGGRTASCRDRGGLCRHRGKTLQTYEKAVISVDLVLKSSEVRGPRGQIVQVSGRLPGQQQKGHGQATIVDPSGLAVTSLSALNPKRSGNLGPIAIQIVSQLQTAKYHLADGTEIPVRVVLKDEDLDVAFLAPLKPLDAETKAKITTIPLSDAAPRRNCSIRRSSSSVPAMPMTTFRRLTWVSFQGYCQNREAATIPIQCRMALIAFDKQGKVFGLFVALRENLPVLLPVADVAKLLPQALEEAKKPAVEEKSDAEEKKD